MRICSLTPSGTEILCLLGMADQIVGISHRCDFPPQIADRPVVSGIIAPEPGSADHRRFVLDERLARMLAPDLILTQDICEICAVPSSLAEALAQGLVKEPPVLSIDATSIEGIFSAIERVGVVVGRSERARDVVGDMKSRIENVRVKVRGASRPRVAFLEWLLPYWVAGNWVPEAIDIAGGSDGLAKAGERSIRIDLDTLAAYAPEVLVVAPCGVSALDAREAISRVAHIPQWRDLPGVANRQLWQLDGRIWSRFGPRIIDGIEDLARILHPERFPQSEVASAGILRFDD